jgi:CDP-paratose 2-epimerase
MGKVEQGVVALWVARHLWGDELNYIGFGGSGKQVRDILAVDDLFELLVRQMAALDSLNGQVFNIGGGSDVSVSLLELTELCYEVTGRRIPIGCVPETRPGDIPYYVTDNSKIQSYIDWRPIKCTKDIVSDIADWLLANESSVRPILS